MQEKTVARISKGRTNFKITMDKLGYNLYKWSDTDNDWQRIRHYSPFAVFRAFVDWVLENQYTNLLEK